MLCPILLGPFRFMWSGLGGPDYPERFRTNPSGQDYPERPELSQVGWTPLE